MFPVVACDWPKAMLVASNTKPMSAQSLVMEASVVFIMFLIL